MNRNTVNLWYRNFREQILDYIESSPTKKLSGEIELDESYFGGQRKSHAQDRRKRSRGAENKMSVFGVLKRDGKVYTQIIKNASKQELMPIVRQLIQKQSTIYTNKWKACDGLVLDGYRHYRINHSKEFYKGKTNHINGMENSRDWSNNETCQIPWIKQKKFLPTP